MSQFDYFVAGRWRNKEQIELITKLIRESGKSAFCFLENDYSEILARLGLDVNAMQSSNTEQLPLDHPLIKEIFAKDLKGQSESENFLLVLPAGIAGHVEAGIAYGMGKKCYAVGTPEKTETLYAIFDRIFPDVQTLENWLAQD